MASRLTHLPVDPPFTPRAPGVPVNNRRYSAGVALCTLALVALIPAAAPASAPVHQVKGSGTFWLDVGDGPDGFNLVQYYSFRSSGEPGRWGNEPRNQ